MRGGTEWQKVTFPNVSQSPAPKKSLTVLHSLEDQEGGFLMVYRIYECVMFGQLHKAGFLGSSNHHYPSSFPYCAPWPGVEAEGNWPPCHQRMAVFCTHTLGMVAWMVKGLKGWIVALYSQQPCLQMAPPWWSSWWLPKLQAAVGEGSFGTVQASLGGVTSWHHLTK